jgi:putative tricarboxylic transport membrane protein
MLLLMNIPLVGLFVRVLLIPPKFLMPIVAMVSFVGIYGISGSTFDLMVMVVFGILGWGLRKLEVPLVPVIMGILLGNAMEASLRRAMIIDDGDWTQLFHSPLSIGLWTVAVVGFVLPILFGKAVKRRIQAAKTASDETIAD